MNLPKITSASYLLKPIDFIRPLHLRLINLNFLIEQALKLLQKNPCVICILDLSL